MDSRSSVSDVSVKLVLNLFKTEKSLSMDEGHSHLPCRLH